MRIVSHIIIWVAAAVTFKLLTKPPELQGERKWKPGVSHWLLFIFMIGLGVGAETVNLPLPVLELAAAYAGFTLALMWAPNVASLGSNGLGSVLFGDGQAGGGFRTDYREARSLIDDGDLKGALKAVERELAKEPKDFEGRLLLATVYNNLKQPAKAAEQMDVILNNPEATDGQKADARKLQEEYLNLLNPAGDAPPVRGNPSAERGPEPV